MAHYKKKVLQPKQKVSHKAPFLLLKDQIMPHGLQTWRTILALKMGGGPKVKRGKASNKKPTYPSQFKAHDKKKNHLFG